MNSSEIKIKAEWLCPFRQSKTAMEALSKFFADDWKVCKESISELHLSLFEE
ncbi:hypothetical protein [Marivirga tractuosa]|uniref:hypothetical protein n=1 Tax=Marivirga tractuosa TaxID=1006 RepID=UPI0003046652|nr:hypothetical protein [Marivirga tractuosa]